MNSSKKQTQKVNWGLVYSKLIKFADPGKRGLTSGEKAVLEAIADHMGNRRVAWPGFATIAHFSGLSRSTVIRTVQKLAARGILQKDAGAGADSNHYTIDSHAIGRLITKPKYQERAGRWLARLAERPETSVTVTPPQCQDATTTSVTATLGGVTVTPERPRNAPPRTRSKNDPPREREQGDLRSGGGQEGQGRLSDFINHHRISELVGATLDICGDTLAPSTRPVGSVARSTVILFKEIESEEGRLPEPQEVADSFNDPAFARLHSRSFGLLTAPAKRGDFKAAIVRRIRNQKLRAALLAPNAADRHDRAVEEAKRDSALRSAQVLEQDRLPPWLRELQKQNPEDPDVKQWVAEELAKPRPPAQPVPVPPPPPTSQKAERPIGYDLYAKNEEELLAISLND